MKDSIREKLGVDKNDFVFLSVIITLLLVALAATFVPFLNANPLLSIISLGFTLVLGSSVHLLRKYLEVRRLEAQPSAEELLKKQYVENEDLEIDDYSNKYEKLKQIEREN